MNANEDMRARYRIQFQEIRISVHWRSFAVNALWLRLCRAGKSVAIGGLSLLLVAARPRCWLLAFCVLIGCASSVAGVEIVIDFEQAEIGKPVTNWVEKDVTFTLAHQPKQSRAAGRVMFFPHLATNRKGILCAMANEQIPVQARFANGASSVKLKLWGSTGCAALLEAFDASGRVVDKTSVAVVPGRARAEDPIPFFELSVKASYIAYVQFSGPRTGEYLAADEMRFVPIAAAPQ